MGQLALSILLWGPKQPVTPPNRPILGLLSHAFFGDSGDDEVGLYVRDFCVFRNGRDIVRG